MGNKSSTGAQGASQNASQYAAQGLSPRSGKPIIAYRYNRQDDLRSMTPEQILAIDINDVPRNIDERFANPPLSDLQLKAVESLAAKKEQARPYNSGGARKRRRKTRKIRRKNNKK